MPNYQRILYRSGLRVVRMTANPEDFFLVRTELTPRRGCGRPVLARNENRRSRDKERESR